MLRLEAANLLDRALRLKDQLEAERRSPASAILGRIEAWGSVLRRTTGSARRHRSPKQTREALRCAAVLLKSGLFDAEHYLRRNPDVAARGAEPVTHYVLHGASEMRDPSPFFSTRWYVERYPDVAQSGENPLYHYIVRGHSEGRQPTPPAAGECRPTGARSGHGAVDQGAAPAARSADPGPARLVVYTALFGDYDDLFVPSREQAESCDFVIFTDQPDVPPPWRRAATCYAAPSRARQNRFYKLLPHRLFPQHEWSLYIDGNIDIRMNPLDLLDRYCHRGPDFFVFRHPKRTKVVEELAACIELNKDDGELMVRQVAEYLDGGFRHVFALTENNVLLRRHNDPELATLSEAWWDEVRSKSQRDQLSLSYVVERLNYRKIALFDEGRTTTRYYPGLGLRPHRAAVQARGLRDGAAL